MRGRYDHGPGRSTEETPRRDCFATPGTTTTPGATSPTSAAGRVRWSRATAPPRGARYSEAPSQDSFPWGTRRLTGPVSVAGERHRQVGGRPVGPVRSARCPLPVQQSPAPGGVQSGAGTRPNCRTGYVRRLRTAPGCRPPARPRLGRCPGPAGQQRCLRRIRRQGRQRGKCREVPCFRDATGGRVTEFICLWDLAIGGMNYSLTSGIAPDPRNFSALVSPDASPPLKRDNLTRLELRKAAFPSASTRAIIAHAGPGRTLMTTLSSLYLMLSADEPDPNALAAAARLVTKMPLDRKSVV